MYLRADEREELERIVRAARSPQRDVRRARIALMAAAGLDNRVIAQLAGTSENTVSLWRRRLSREGLPGLHDRPRPGRPSPFTPIQRARVIQKAVELPQSSGQPYTHWSTAELARAVCDAGVVTSITSSTVAKWLNAADLQPHRCRYWLKITDTEFEARMQDVTGLYLRAPELAARGVPVFCVDEKTSMQALERQTPDLLMRPGRPHRRDHRYIRHGSTCLIGVFQVATGKVWGRFTPDRKATTVARFLQEVAASVPEAPEIHFVMDQVSTHWHLAICHEVARLSGVPYRPRDLRTGAQRRAFLADTTKRVVIHFTPVRASWLDQIEIWFSGLARRVLARGSFASLAELQARVYAYIDHHNRFLARPYRWTYTGAPCRT